jgi:XTP/dITP diphosphohydrolase
VPDTVVLVATRSEDKLREIHEIASPTVGLRFLGLKDVGIPWSEREEALEVFDTFAENALAKARYFHDRSGLTVLADDSGLCVDALGGQPGVLSKRFSGRSDLSGLALDQSNNEHLLASLSDRDPPRAARYVCAIAVVSCDAREDAFLGSLHGEILTAPRGTGGFGYDPLFWVPHLGATLAEVAPEVKNRISHRSEAVLRALPRLREMAARCPETGSIPPISG